MAGSIAVAAATRSRAIWFGGYGAGIAFMSWSYLVWLPRILAERHAAERAVDPTAAARQQRERRWRAASLLFGALTGSAAVVWAACNS
jgi:hypothetical protein